MLSGRRGAATATTVGDGGAHSAVLVVERITIRQ
jgi:hypothetical protein